MSVWEAILLGIIQGLAEFLPVSSSGHLELANVLFGIEGESNLQFIMAVHAATVMSTIVVFWKEIARLLRGLFQFRMNDETVFLFNILISMVPVGIVGLFFKDSVESLFTGNLLLVGAMLLVTALLLVFSNFAKVHVGKVTPKSAFIIGIAQALAVLPGLSRSGATISTGLMLGIRREEVSKFSFLMVLIPVIGMNLLELLKGGDGATLGSGVLIAGFMSAFLTGTFACRAMIRLVNKGKLLWFAVYCAVVGLVAIGVSIF